MKAQKKESIGAPMRVIDEATLDTWCQTLEDMRQITIDNLQLLRHYTESLEQHTGEMLRFVAAQGPAGKKAIEKLKQADPGMAEFVEAAFQRVPLQ